MLLLCEAPTSATALHCHCSKTVTLYEWGCKTVMKSKLKLIYDRQSVSQSVLVSGTHLGPATNFSFSLKFPLDSSGFDIL
jgi:hypothetical protein